jgi:hypothetical protein
MVGKAMELKDMILSTLEELDIEQGDQKKESFQNGVKELTKEIEVEEIDLGNNTPKPEETPKTKPQDQPTTQVVKQSDNSLTFADPLKEENREFLLNLRERVLVLFEGFQAPNNQKIEEKIELTLNFFEYLLAVIDEKLENSK